METEGAPGVKGWWEFQGGGGPRRSETEWGPGGQRQRGPRELGGGGSYRVVGVPGGWRQRRPWSWGGWGAREVRRSQAPRSCWGRWWAGGLAEVPLLEVSRDPGSSCAGQGPGLAVASGGASSPRHGGVAGRKPPGKWCSGASQAQWDCPSQQPAGLCVGDPVPCEGPPVRLPCFWACVWL